MRYELREWTDNDGINYIVRATSDDAKALESYIQRPSIPNDIWYRLTIVDTKDTLS